MATQPQSLGTQLVSFIDGFFSFIASLFGRKYTGTVFTPQQSGVTTKIINNRVVQVQQQPYPAISAEDAIRKAIKTETNINWSDFTDAIINSQAQMIRDGQYMDGNGFQWNGTAGQNTPKLSLVDISARIAPQAVQTGGQLFGVAASTVSAATSFVGSAAGVVQQLFSWHSAAVAKEQSDVAKCNPPAENAFEIIINAVKTGERSPSWGIAAMDATVLQYQACVSGSKNNSPFCSATCEYLVWVRAMAYYWKDQFAAIAYQTQ